MAFTEFCCKSGGSNLNAGTRTGNSTEPGTSADFTYASGTWVSATGVFTVASGDPSADGVAVGDFASVYADGATVTTLVGRVTARTSTTITVSTTAKAGTTTDGTSNRTLKIGGAWQGPNGTSFFPFTLATLASLANAAAEIPRINIKAGTYSMTGTAGSITNAGPFKVQGYTTSYSDGGRPVIDGGASGSHYTMVTLTCTNTFWQDLAFTRCGATGTGISFWTNSGNTKWFRCVWYSFRGNPYFADGIIEECEFYGNNIGNQTSAAGGARIDGGFVRRSIFHDNTDNGCTVYSGSVTFVECVFDSNTKYGLHLTETGAGSSQRIIGCDFYNNTSDGCRNSNSSGTAQLTIENCNFVKNGGYGFNANGAGRRIGTMMNCGYGAGTQANTSGATNGTGDLDVSGAVTYASDATPWTDPANGDFRISLAAAKGAGRGAFTQTAASYAGTVGYPDIGAAQSAASGGGIPIARGMHGGMR
jgi:hypothetical protein